MSRIWAGTDCGKTHHHTLVLDADGKTLLSRRVANDESELLKLIGDVLDLADGDKTTWALDMTGGEPGLLIALLVFYTSALISVQHDLNSRKFYDRKRAAGKRHVQAVLALARRRVNVLWSLIRDRRCYQIAPPVTEAA